MASSFPCHQNLPHECSSWLEGYSLYFGSKHGVNVAISDFWVFRTLGSRHTSSIGNMFFICCCIGILGHIMLPLGGILSICYKNGIENVTRAYTNNEVSSKAEVWPWQHPLCNIQPSSGQRHAIGSRSVSYQISLQQKLTTVTARPQGVYMKWMRNAAFLSQCLIWCECSFKRWNFPLTGNRCFSFLLCTNK